LVLLLGGQRIRGRIAVRGGFEWPETAYKEEPRTKPHGTASVLSVPLGYQIDLPLPRKMSLPPARVMARGCSIADQLTSKWLSSSSLTGDKSRKAGEQYSGS
jgi:hypothetical protein